MSSAPCSVLREPRSGLNAQPTSARPEATRFALGRFRHGRQNRPAALRYWNKARQRYCRSLVRYCSTLRVSADRAANRAAHTRGKPRLLDVGRRIPARDRFAPDSPLEGDGFEPPVPRHGELMKFALTPSWREDG